MHDYELYVRLVDGQLAFGRENEPAGTEDFTFSLKWKDQQFGDVHLEHWWMDIRSIYRTRNSEAVNCDPLIDFWWRSCVEGGSNQDTDVCQSFVLAKSLEFTRTNGARNVFLDSILRRENADRRREVDANLENMLRSSTGEELTILEFSRQTENHLGAPELPEEVFELQREFENQLFERTVPLLQNGEFVDVAQIVSRLWETWKTQVRRGVPEVERQVVDVMSYEAKSAIHRCYSHFWMNLAYWLAGVRACNDESLVFHRFWHTDMTWPSTEDADSFFHLFHGHVLALHPGTFAFMRTETGKRLIGDWLSLYGADGQHSGGREPPEFRRLLNGLLVAMLDYSSRLETSRSLRRRP